MMEEFHLLRPWWLLAVPPLALLAWWRLRVSAADPWRGIVDAHLLPHLLAGGGRTGRLAAVLAAVGCLLTIAALAGPTWSRAPVPSFRSAAPPLVIALDLSRSMDATDLAPSRLAVAKEVLRDLLDRAPPREVGLVVFAASAHPVLPLTEDAAVLRDLLPHLAGGLMPVQGSAPAEALRRAGALIRDAGRDGGDVLLIGDGAGPAAAAEAARLAGGGVRVSVLAVGSAAGGLIPEPDGNPLEIDGRPLRVALDSAGLRAVAEAGGGAFGDHSGLDPFLARLAAAAPAAAAEPATATARWRDAGPLLVLALLPLAALAFRRGWLGVVLALFLFDAAPAAALDWRDLWLRRDQQGLTELRRGRPERARRLFEDRFWRGAAEYRDGDFAAAAESFAGLESAAAHYNRGNALARLGHLDEAAEAYRQALAIEPGHADAGHNLDLVRRAAARGGGGEGELQPAPMRREGGEPPPPAAEQAGEDAPERRSRRPGAGSGGGGGGKSPAEAPRDGGAPSASGEGEAGSGADRHAETSPPPEPTIGQENEAKADAARPPSDPAASPRAGAPARQPPPREPKADSRAGRAGRSGSGSPDPGETASAGTAAEQAGNDRETPGADDAAPEPDDARMTDAGKIGRDDADQPPRPENEESRQALLQWLERIPDDPSGLLRELFRRDLRRSETAPAGGQPW